MAVSLPGSCSNSTTYLVVDGHTVVINETEYKNEDDFGGTFFKVRIIDVKPDSSELTTEREAEAVPSNVSQESKDREEVENSVENEIPKSKEAEKSANTENHDNISLYDESNGEFENIETFDEEDLRETEDSLASTSSGQHRKTSPIKESRFSTNKDSEWYEEEGKTLDSEWGNVDPVVSIDSNAIDAEEGSKVQRPFDLSRDTYVNEIMAKNGAPVNPDAEVFYVDQNPAKKNSRSQPLIDPR